MIKKLKDWLFPITLFVFVAPTVAYLSAIFTLKVRWLFLYLLAAQLVFFYLKKKLNLKLWLIFFLYILWCFLTSFWSEAPKLSFLKASAFFLVMFTMLFAGQSWILKHGERRSLDFLGPVAVVAFLAAILGYETSGAYSPFGEEKLYQGLVGGPNMMGSLLAMSTPLILWQIYKDWSRPRRRMLWLAVCVIVFIFLFLTQARSSLLSAAFVLGGFMLTFKAKKVITMAYLTVLVVVGIYVAMPGFQSDVKKKIIYKYATEEQGVFYTREQVWDESLEQAKLGGWIGAGYGVTIGSPAWAGGWTTIGYGREKGNSQFAIVEETGIIGLILYILLIVALFNHIFRSFRNTKDRQTKVALGLVIGAMSGFIAQSVFEAWWVAPGSPESVIFWAITGAGLGLGHKNLSDTEKMRNERKARKRRIVW